MPRTVRTVNAITGDPVDLSSYSDDADPIDVPLLRLQWNAAMDALDALVAGRAEFDGPALYMAGDPIDPDQVARKSYVDQGDTNTLDAAEAYADAAVGDLLIPSVMTWDVGDANGVTGLSIGGGSITSFVPGSIVFWQVEAPPASAPSAGLVDVRLYVDGVEASQILWNLAAGRFAYSSSLIAVAPAQAIEVAIVGYDENLNADLVDVAIGAVAVWDS